MKLGYPEVAVSPLRLAPLRSMQDSQVTASPIPRGLLRSPRRVCRKRGTLGPILLGRILTAPVLAAAAALLGLALLEPIVVFVIPAQTARVIGRGFKADRRSGLFVDYRFDQSGFMGRDQVLPNEFDAFQIGQVIKAHLIHLGRLGYSALDRPLRAYARYRMILWFCTSFALAIGGVLFYAIWLLPWRSYWLTQHGKATFGAVVEKSIVHGSRRLFYFTLTYQFRASGDLYARRIRISPQRYDSAGVRDLVIILFDPKRPGRNIVYDYCDFVAS
jgi:hypothetical protein